MTDRGLPIVDGAPACPFVAFEDDRDARATSPDHRHRCYAEIRPAPRALAHQEAYCLSSAFPICPTFQDWARREAATTRGRAPEGSAGAAGAAAAAAAAADMESAAAASRAGDPRSAGAGGNGEGDDFEGEPGSPPGMAERNPPRNWAAPPPWLTRDDRGDDSDEPEVRPQPPARGGGLAGSFADRLAGGPPPAAPPPAAPPPAAAPPTAPPPTASSRDRWDGDDGEDALDEDDEAWTRRSAARRAAAPGRDRRGTSDDRRPDDRGDEVRADGPALAGPSWERPRRLEAYPTLKTRMGLARLGVPSILVGLVAILLAAVALFFLPTLLGIGNPPSGDASPSPTADASAGASTTPAAPTPTPGPTQAVYVVQPGDTLSGIASELGVPYEALLAANPQITNPDQIAIGDEIIIPVAAPTSLPGVTPTPVP